jgi:hypothetical protein
METIQKIRAEMGWVTEDNIVSNAGGAKVGA